MSGLAIEFFSCSGGMAEGFRRAGIEFNYVFDKDPDACESYEQNLGHRPTQMDVRDLLRMVRGGWKPGLVRLLVADPPCTPWSRAGKRQGTADPRDMLLPTVDLCAEDRIMPPGHHGGSNLSLSQPNAIVLSERAAAVLQGFPDRWVFAGKTKKTRCSQIGQAMPPMLAHAVATSIMRQMEQADKR